MDQLELLRRARGGDRQAMTSMVLAEQRVVRSYLACLAPDPTTADDLAQEVFLVAFHKDPSLPVRDLRGYLLGIARNLAREAWRTQQRRREVGGEGAFAAVESRLAVEAPDGEDDSQLAALRRCLQRLSPRSLQVVQHFYHEELCSEEIAARVGLSASAVRVLLTRCRTSLHDCVVAATAARP